MRTQLMLLATLAVAAAVPLDRPEGRYYPDSGDGRYVHDTNEGRYIHDDSGKYNPDPSGNYRHDGLGGYRDDGTGRYAGQKDPYAHSRDKFGSSGNLVGANTFQSTQVRPAPRPKIVVPPANAFGNLAAATQDYGKIATGVTGTGKYNDEGRWKIIRQVGDVDLDGYHWEYLTENKINAEERGKVFNVGTADEALRAKGFFKYTGPDNVEYHIEYTADENGFVPHGEHIPTPPPIPEAIQRALAYQRSIGTL